MRFADDRYFGTKEGIATQKNCLGKAAVVTAVLAFGSIALNEVFANSGSGLIERGVT